MAVSSLHVSKGMTMRLTACQQQHGRHQTPMLHAWAQPCAQLLRVHRCATCRRHHVHGHAHAHAGAPLSLPEPLWSAVEGAGRSWEAAALEQPLKEEAVAARIHLLGVAHYAPLQDELVTRVLSQLQPSAVALEMPLDQGGGPGSSVLPYPQIIQVLLDHQPLLHALSQRVRAAVPPAPSAVAAAPSSSGSSGSNSAPRDFGAGVWEMLDGMQLDAEATSEDAVQALRSLIDALCDPTLKTKGRVGKDIMDPFESLGFYAGLELALQPPQVAAALQLFGFAPGSEYAAAVHWALECGSQVVCVDAALRLQEAWVAAAVRGFALRESDLPRRLSAEDAAARALVVPGHAAWEAGLPQAVDEVIVASTTFEDASAKQQLGASSGARLLPMEEGLLEEGPLRLPGMYLDAAAEVAHMTAYKVSRATAAAALGAGAATERGTAAQAATQPLKFALFESRALHLARQLRELTRRNAPKAEPVSGTDSSSGQEQQYVVVAVVGRQYVPMIRRLWEDHNSPLWRGDVPHTFAPSTIEPIARTRGDHDPDVTRGGSRPVGQKPLNLGMK